MPRARRKPSQLPEFQTTDTGPNTPAQRHGAVYARPRDGRAGDIRKIRQHPLERMAERGALSQAEKDRAMIAVKLYEATQRGGAALREYVDGQPDPEMPAITMVDAKFSYARAVREIPDRNRRVFNHVVEQGGYLITMRGCRTSHAERTAQLKLLRGAIDALNV